jgi:hypothetical protein
MSQSTNSGLSLSWRTVPWHPVLLAAVIVIAFWMDAVVSPYPAIRPLVVAVVATAALTILAGLVLRNRHAGAVAVTGIIGLLYTKHLVRLVADVAPGMPPLVLVLWLVAMALVVLLATRLVLRSTSGWRWPDATWLLNRVALVLLLATLLGGLVTGAFARGVAQLRQGASLPTGASAAPVEGPDIYVVLLDGYPRADVLRHAFDFENGAFIGELEARGFEVADQAHSDYLWTHVSLASLLNMAYVEQIEILKPVVAGQAATYPRVTDAVNHNPVFAIARQQGYKIVAVSGGFDQLTPREADVFLDTGQLNEFEVKLLNSTFLGQVFSTAAPTFASGQHGDRIRDSLRALAEVARAPRSAPRLVIAHVPSPHQPTVFRRDGSVLPVPVDDAFYADSAAQKGQSVEDFAANYRDHLSYLNQLVIGTLDDVLAASPEPPIIVFVADHGSASRVDWNATQPSDADPAVLLERTGILFAALTPDHTDAFPEDVSPVNVFRYLFDAYFETQLGPASPPPDGGQIPPVDAAVLE